MVKKKQDTDIKAPICITPVSQTYKVIHPSIFSCVIHMYFFPTGNKTKEGMTASVNTGKTSQN